ncbi:tRNA pseudouridine(13) synthase TruD [Campylobacter canadensis]|uniref:tRNA pseudouridine(13) synthase TruD n=1 Tax=Campylobacter canadensis TaxID=449520 RepID=UPI001551C862|nr:tRNA pseudouridine(13) synthase TruD [Campylobacter canadensis]MBZ7995309.1 tRNA pseudouridine(13) synthase TruD [Campylobacter canadensis]MBZ7997009.1 tRNA pseudouridine(13) synthase TruD [Campylobacter canadensis]MBZ8000673.1 tRNA pseudouridine(13) synthase TruD [Campylobacter canadensis]MBZ8002479.1 tRNA pseudouridine(13) synthase TruD [Campylobacter canadensis]MBZ8004630.1 tRNA pseudouridine(13) synthase TruD [Campylobacter canadensis]
MNLRANKHSKINVHFSKNSQDFVVREIPMYEFSQNGEHLILHIQKKDLTTNDLLKDLSAATGVKQKDFGYAGLKDKLGLTYQYISMPKKYEKELKNFSHEKCKIIDTFTHNNKIKLGHLKGNSFFLRLKKVNKIDALKLEQVFTKIAKQGYPNYFGYQRFGKEQNNAQSGEDILKNKIKFKNHKLNKFLISALQSELFNRYLSKRIEISHFAQDFSKKELKEIFKDEKLVNDLKEQEHFFKLFDNELFEHYPFGKLFNENLQNAKERFLKQDISPSALILGANPRFNSGYLFELEQEIFKDYIELLQNQNGSRRYLWSFLQNASFKYNEELAHFCIEFTLQKGSYATVVLSELLNDEIIF